MDRSSAAAASLVLPTSFKVAQAAELANVFDDVWMLGLEDVVESKEEEEEESESEDSAAAEEVGLRISRALKSLPRVYNPRV